MENEIIFQPLRFRNLEIKNRLLRSSISGMFDDYNGHGGNARLNWEEKFARGGIGAIISAFTPVAIRGRILVRYATIDDDNKIGFWQQVAKRVHQYGCKYILQLSHSGRQQDMGGVENLFWKPLSSTNQKIFHGILSQAMTARELRNRIVAEGRAKTRGLMALAARQQRLSSPNFSAQASMTVRTNTRLAGKSRDRAGGRAGDSKRLRLSANENQRRRS
jgi:2,4-dienoyl-CoA reductase (NADPH2)